MTDRNLQTLIFRRLLEKTHTRTRGIPKHGTTLNCYLLSHISSSAPFWNLQNCGFHRTILSFDRRFSLQKTHLPSPSLTSKTRQVARKAKECARHQAHLEEEIQVLRPFDATHFWKEISQLVVEVGNLFWVGWNFVFFASRDWSFKLNGCRSKVLKIGSHNHPVNKEKAFQQLCFWCFSKEFVKHTIVQGKSWTKTCCFSNKRGSCLVHVWSKFDVHNDFLPLFFPWKKTQVQKTPKTWRILVSFSARDLLLGSLWDVRMRSRELLASQDWSVQMVSIAVMWCTFEDHPRMK